MSLSFLRASFEAWTNDSVHSNFAPAAGLAAAGFAAAGDAGDFAAAAGFWAAWDELAPIPRANRMQRGPNQRCRGMSSRLSLGGDAGAGSTKTIRCAAGAGAGARPAKALRLTARRCSRPPRTPVLTTAPHIGRTWGDFLSNSGVPDTHSAVLGRSLQLHHHHRMHRQ